MRTFSRAITKHVPVWLFLCIVSAFFISCNNELQLDASKLSGQSFLSFAIAGSRVATLEDSFDYSISVYEEYDYSQYEHDYSNGQEYYEEYKEPELYSFSVEGTSSNGSIIVENMPIGKTVNVSVRIGTDDGIYYGYTENAITIVSGKNPISLNLEKVSYSGELGVTVTLPSDAGNIDDYTFEYGLDSATSLESAYFDVENEDLFYVSLDEYGEHTILVKARTADGLEAYSATQTFKTSLSYEQSVTLSLEPPANVTLRLSGLPPVPVAGDNNQPTYYVSAQEATTGAAVAEQSGGYFWFATVTLSYGTIENTYSMSNNTQYATLITNVSTTENAPIALPPKTDIQATVRLYSLDEHGVEVFERNDSEKVKELEAEIREKRTPAYTGSKTFTTTSGAQTVDIEVSQK